MATASVSKGQLRNAWWRPKYLLFGFVGLMLVYVLQHNESFLIHPDAPIWNHYRTIQWSLLPHALAGACALLLGPLQFSDRLRSRFIKLHRVVGWIYIVGALIAAPMGFWVQFLNERIGEPRSFSFAAAAQASQWIITTVVALILIRQGKVDQHRRWMTRSFAVALIFLEVRVIMGVTGWERLGPSAVETVVWMCNVFAILIADLIMQAQEMLRARPKQVAARAAQ
jgi:uncharacterized membrane protein